VPRSPSDRSPAAADAAALEAAARQALERGAAPAPPPPAPSPDRPGPAVRVRQTAPVRGAAVQGRSRGARSFVLRRKGRAKRDEPPAGRAAPDPRGRGGRLDVRA